MKTEKNFRVRLLDWYEGHKRAMPWRGTRDAYRIWLSEVMLQQTRVAAAVDYYRRFLKRFPAVQALARARSEEVLKLWAGLGYYSRARNLHRAAKEIVARHGGKFPREMDAALALPGVGRYTAAAVLSIAYDAPHAVLDGNVARVLARLGAVRGDLRVPRRWQALQQDAQQLLAVERPGDWNQAMMELGATVCTPRAPRCEACPISRWCRAYAQGVAEEVPEARRKRATVKITLAAAVLVDRRGRALLVKPNGLGRNEGLFSRMWQFPAVEVTRDPGDELRRHLRSIWNGTKNPKRKDLTLRKRRGTEGREKDGTGKLVALKKVRHTVTFREITLAPYLMRVGALPEVRGARAVLLGKLNSLPVSSATRKIAQRAIEVIQRV